MLQTQGCLEESAGTHVSSWGRDPGEPYCGSWWGAGLFLEIG